MAIVSVFGVVSAAMPSRANGKSHGVRMQLWAYWMSMLSTFGRLPTLPDMHDVALVLDRPRLAAVAHAQIALPLVGAERHEQDQRALVDQMAGQFGKLGVVADHHADRAAVGRDDVDAVAALDVPPVALVRRRVDLLLLVHRTVAQEDIADVVDVAVVRPRRMRAADDVDVVADRQLLHEVDERAVYSVSRSIASTGVSFLFSIDSSCSVNSSGKTTKSMR